MLSIELLGQISKIANNNIFEISSEALQIFHVLFGFKKEKDRIVVADFIVSNYDKVIN